MSSQQHEECSNCLVDIRYLINVISSLQNVSILLYLISYCLVYFYFYYFVLFYLSYLLFYFPIFFDDWTTLINYSNFLFHSIFSETRFNNYLDIGAASNRLLNIQKYNLKYLQYCYFGHVVEEPMTVEKSTERYKLSHREVKYGSYNAVMGRQIYDCINERGK